jgi:hypothetical protein
MAMRMNGNLQLIGFGRWPASSGLDRALGEGRLTKFIRVTLAMAHSIGDMEIEEATS